jgi:diguanylate cyclase (GGDEF)-like protein
MNLLDMRTVISSYMLSNLICLIFIAVLWINNHKRFLGLGYWVADYFLQFLALVLIALRGMVPDFVSMTISNSMIIGGTLMIYIGLGLFIGKRKSQWYNYLFMIVFILLHAYYVIIRPNLDIRTIIFSSGLLFLCLQCAWLMLWHAIPDKHDYTRGVGLVFIFFCIISVERIITMMTLPSSGNDFFHSNITNSLSLLIYQMFFIILTFSLFSMVNRRIFARMERGITARERAEALLGVRLILWEYAADHSTRELMQKALDEIEALTNSRIGFYHFVEEETHALTLQAWSTATSQDFCKAEGAEMHYSIDQAGVWVDCIYQRQPVIHNDYASLPHRKGMPAGHAEVIRELVVPTMRAGKIVSILGVGNKPTEYDENDIELVAYIADVIWTIVLQKRAAEKITQLNNKLEQLAMTDELTGLANRRAFFILGSHEVKQAARYQLPLSLIMLDIDKFKDINDNHGHETGDLILQMLAKTIKKGIRGVDVAARLGGEEFAVLLPSTHAAGAAVTAERLRLAVMKKYILHQGRKIAITISAGVAEYNKEKSDLDILLRNADVAMYQAKEEGRNQVVVFE